MFDFTSRLTLRSVAAYCAWRLRTKRDPIVLNLQSGPRFELRENCSGNNDYGVAYEVFVMNYYDDHNLLDGKRVDLVVDLGVNVGFSLLYFLHKFEHCNIIGFEPHPGHFVQAKRNLVLDDNAHRVQLYRQAAGAKTRLMQLSDSASSSSLIPMDLEQTVTVEVVDIFPLLQGKRIDLLKMDIEGGEYEILGDPRFEKLEVDAIVMEWHSRGRDADDKHWCQHRLIELGFTIDEIFTEPGYGMFWAI